MKFAGAGHEFARANNVDSFWQDYQRRRWMHPTAHLYMRPDAARWLQPNQRLWQAPDLTERKYNRDQPRVPAGGPDGGQWTDGNGGLIHLAGDIPTGDPPYIPNEPPLSTKLRNLLVRSLAVRLGSAALLAAGAGTWIYDHKEEISSYFDSPKTLEELQKGAQSPAKGYDVHHIVERASADKNGSEDDLIDAPENLVRIPRWKHWQINGYYQTASDEFGGLSPRQYLKGKSWEERTRVGLDALERFGILRR